MSDNTKQLYKKSSDGTYPKIFPLAFVQGIKDKRNNKELLSYINEINHFKVDYTENPETTRCQVDVYIRKKGLYITYYNTDTEQTVTEYFKGNQSDATDDSIWGNSDNWELVPDKTYIENHAVIPNKSVTLDKLGDDVMAEFGPADIAPDEEDLTTINKKIKFKDRIYLDAGYTGMGYKILRKNMIDGVNVLTQDMISDENTIYEVRYDFILSEDITVPVNCVLEFDGGSILNNGTNNTITFTNTMLKGCVKCYATCTGTLSNDEIEVDWFISNNNPTAFLTNLNNLSGFYVINFTRGKEYLIDAIYMRYNYGIQISNVEFRGNGCTLKPVDTEYMTTAIVGLQNCTNVKFADFNIHDIVESLETTTLKYRHGLNITSCNNVEICNVNFTECVHDGIRTEGCNRITIDNISVNRYGRNGISLIDGQNILITNSIIKNHVVSENIPSEAHCSIDIEPNGGNVYLKNISIYNNKFYDAPINIFPKDTLLDEMDISIFDNSFTGAKLICNWYQFSDSKGNVIFKNNVLQEYDVSAINISTSSLTNIYTHLINNTIHNVCKQGSTILEGKCAVGIFDRGSSKIDTNIGNVFIDGLTIIQDTAYTSNMPIIVAAYPYTGNSVENVYIKNVKTFGCTFAYDTYDTIYSRIPSDSIDESALAPMLVTNSVSQALNLSNKYILTKNALIELKNSIALFTDTIKIVNNYNVCNIQVSKLFTSDITAYYFNGTAVEANDIIQNTREIVITKISDTKCVVTFARGQVKRNNEIIIDSSTIARAYSSANFPTDFNKNQLFGLMAYNYTTDKPMWFSDSGKWIEADGVNMNTPRSGTWANKPTVAVNNIGVGYKYFCTDKQTTEGATDGIEIIHKGSDIWVDALGRIIT